MQVHNRHAPTTRLRPSDLRVQERIKTLRVIEEEVNNSKQPQLLLFLQATDEHMRNMLVTCALHQHASALSLVPHGHLAGHCVSSIEAEAYDPLGFRITTFFIPCNSHLYFKRNTDIVGRQHGLNLGDRALPASRLLSLDVERLAP